MATSSNIKFFREAIFALGITVLGGFVTGILWANLYETFSVIVGIIALIPVISQMRGNISGIFTSRLGTGLNLGSIEPSIKKRSKELNNSIYMNIILSIMVPLWAALSVYLFHLLSGGSTPYIRFLFIGMLGSVISGSIQIFITLLIAFTVYKKGMDPDILVYPILSFVADIITVISILIAFTIEGALYPLFFPLIQAIIEMIFLFIFLLFLIVIFSRPIRSKIEFELVNLLAEAMPVMLFTVIIGSLVGLILNDSIKYEGIILILPIYMAYTGSMGSIVGSTYTTAYYLGTPMKRFYTVIPTILLGIGTILSIILGIIGYTLSTILEFSLPNISMLTYILICLITGLMATMFSVLNALLLGNATFKRGLDADNIIVPITSTIGDLVAVISIVLTINVFVT